MPQHDARSVANLLLDIAEADNFDLTQMSILKIIYFAHGWYLACHNAPLIAQEFEAWEFGPVVKVVRDEFAACKGEKISKRAYKLDIFLGEKRLPDPIEDLYDVEFIRKIYIEYRQFSAWKLSEMTHEAGSPWDQIWNSTIPSGRLGLRIKNGEIKQHFLGLSRSGALS
jgi:uncharacterized phage-associated protein